MSINKILRIEIILVVALILRILWACFVKVEPVADSFIYDAFARSISSGYGYAYPDGSITAYWPVGTPAVYAFLYWIFGMSYVPIVILNTIIGTLIVWLTYVFALGNFGKRTAIISALVVSFWPVLIQFTTILASELLFIFLLLFAIFIWTHQKISLIPRSIIWGTLICGASYIRPIAYPLLVIFPLFNWSKTRDLRISMISFIISVMTALILFSPWVYRNYKLFNGFVLVANNNGTNLWMGNNPESDGGYMHLPEGSFKNEFERDRYLKEKAIRFIMDNPVDYLKLSMKRFYITYKSETIGIHWNLSYLNKVVGKSYITGMKLISTIYWWVMLLSGITGALFFVRRQDGWIFSPLVIAMLYYFMIPIFTVGQDRYHMPIIPFLAIFSAYMINYLINGRKVRSINEQG